MHVQEDRTGTETDVVSNADLPGMFRGGRVLSCCALPDDTALTARICPDEDCPGALIKAPVFLCRWPDGKNKRKTDSPS